MASEKSLKTVAILSGMVAGLHEQVKLLEDEFPEMDMVACSLEDIFGILAGLLTGETDAESLALNL